MIEESTPNSQSEETSPEQVSAPIWINTPEKMNQQIDDQSGDE